MKLVKIAAASLNQTALDWPGNRKNILSAIAAARAEEVRILCLPELCIPGYGCEDAYLSPGLQRTCLEVLDEILPETRGLIVSLGLPVRYRNGLFNAACLVVDGRIAGFVPKQHLAGDGLHYEPRWFKPWPGEVVSELDIDGETFPIGDLYFDCGGVRIGFEVCEDAWVSDRPGVSLAQRAVDVILNPSASHFAFGKLAIRERFVVEGSRAFCVAYAYANLVGNASGRAIYDGGALLANGGRLVAAGPRFSYAEAEVTSAVVDLDINRMKQARLASFRPDYTPADDRVKVEFSFSDRPTPIAAVPPPAWEQSSSLKEEEFCRAICLALFDYLRKSRSRGFVVSLSGGADSSAVACLCAKMVELAAAEIGIDGLRDRLSHIDALADAPDTTTMVARTLLCVYQATRNSSATTLNAAREVASGLGAEMMELDVDALVEGYKQVVENQIGRSLAWETDDIALQNIQARARAPGVWMLANLRNFLLLATSNRSEAAVGYATMDGDTCGGISPIAGIDKAFLRQWLRWLEREGPLGGNPVPALSVVNCQAPTAELRPEEANQTDEDDLMPYPLLDAIERAAIRDKQTPVEVFDKMRDRYPDYAASQLATWVERFFLLWCRNQWKRERYAPSFHVDDENLDPKTWCRFPILSGGYGRELAELRERVAELG